MAYGTVKVDNITFDQGGADQNVTASGIYRAITSGVTVTGTISGAILVGTTTVSGTTVTGTTVQGTTVQGVSGAFTSLTGTTTTGTTANFTSGIFTTQVSGATITGTTAQFTSGTFVSLTGTTITGTTISGTTVSSTTGTFTSLTGTTITGTTINGTTVNSITGNFTSLTGVTVTGTTANFTSGIFTTQVSGLTVTGTQSSFTSGNFVTLSGATATFTSGVIASGTAAAPSLSILGDANTGIYSPGADQVAISTNGTGRLFVDASGNVGVGTTPSYPFHVVETSAVTSAASFSTFYGQGTRADLVLRATSSANDQQRQIIRSNSDSLIFGTENAAVTVFTEKMRLDSSGRLLLGQSTNPDGYYFIVNTGSGSNNNAVQLSNNANADLRINLTSGVSLINANTGILALGTSGTERARIDSSGRLLVGRSATEVGLGGSDLLQVTGAINVVLSTNIYSRLLPTSSGLEIIANAYPANLGTTQSIIFKSGTSGGGGPSEIARFTSDGRLLVGTSSDSGGALLQVNGNRIRIATANTPASAGATGTTGEIAWDADYIYVCTATNTWKRTAINTW